MTDQYRIRSPETWLQARDDYRSGLSAEAVCRRHDLGLSAFRKRARRYGWRRMDQDDPAPGNGDLWIYDDIGSHDQVDTARLRFVQALERGQAIEAVRWRRLWLTLREESDAFDEELYPGKSREYIAALLATDPCDPAHESQEERRLLSAG